jgi:type I restriction enzyme M protein
LRAGISFEAFTLIYWLAPSEKDTADGTLERRLWAAADQFHANSGLTAAQYSQPVLGLIFLRFTEARFAAQRAKLGKTATSCRRGYSREPKAL